MVEFVASTKAALQKLATEVKTLKGQSSTGDFNFLNDYLGINPALTQWKSALSTVSTAPAVWFGIGESLQEGQGASTRANRWFNKAGDTLRTAYPAVGSGEFIAARARVYSPDSPWANGYATSSGTLTMRDNSNGTNWGFPTTTHKAIEMLPGTSMTFTVTGNFVDLHWIRALDTGTFTYRVDGGAAVSVSTVGAYATSNQTRVSLGTDAQHTILITGPATAAVFFVGIEVFRGNATSGIHLFDGGWSSATLATPFLMDLNDWIIGVGNIAPDLVTIELGGNDSLQGTSLATFKTQAQQLITALRTLPKKPSIVWVFPSPVLPSLPNAANLVNYQTQIKELVAADPTIGFISLYDNMPVPTTSGTGMYSTDGVHPNNAGQTAIAQLVSDYLK